MATTPKPGFIALADLHAHPWAAFATGDGARNTRLVRTLDVLHRSLAHARSLKVPWVFAGDLVHTAGYSLNIVLNRLTDVLGEFADVEKVAVWGNHDARGVGGALSYDETIWPALVRAVPRLTVLDIDPGCTRRVVAGGLSFSGIGAQPGAIMRVGEKADVGVYHGTVAGSVGPNGYVFEEGLDPKALLARHRVVVVGDIHHPQIIAEVSGKLLLVPGSPEHHDFGDRGVHGWWHVTVGESPAATLVPSGSPEFRKVDLPEQVVQDDGNFYRVLHVPAGATLPPNAQAISPQPDVVREARDTLRGAHTMGETLRAWVKANPLKGVAAATLIEAGDRFAIRQVARQVQPYRLRRMYLRNFCSYAEQDFTVQDGVWLVIGHGRDYPSNGAGKSTLFEALFWLLFGRTTKGLSGDEVIRWGAPGCGVIAEFEHADGGLLRCARSRGSSGHVLEVNDISLEEPDMERAWEAVSVNEMTEKLGARLGLTPSLFQALGYFSQERVLLFASATDSERKEMLGDLIGLAAYQEASALAAEGAVQAAGAVQGTDIARVATIDAIEGDRRDLAEVQGRREQWRKAFQDRLDLATDKLKLFKQDQPRRRQVMIEENMAVADKAVRQRKQAAEWEVQQTRPLAGPETAKDAETAALAASGAHEMVVTLQADIKSAKALLGQAQRTLEQQQATLRGGTCPTCGQVVEDVYRERCLEPARLAVVTAQTKLTNLEDQLNPTVEVAANLQQRYKKLLAKLESGQQYDRAVETVRECDRELTRLRGVTEQQVDRQLQVEARSLEADLARVQAEQDPHASLEQNVRKRIEVGVAKLAELDEAATHNRTLQAVLEYWKHGFSKQGIQSLLVDEVAAVFNNARGRIFPGLTQGVYDVQFSTLSQTKAGEWRERTEFQVFEHGKPVPYAALSGGQRRRIDVGVMLTLVMAVAEWLQVPGALGVLVLDEVFGFLDASGAEGLAEALREVQEHVPSLYVISHDQQLQALFANVIDIEQDAQGVSSIRGLPHGNAGDSDSNDDGPGHGDGARGRPGAQHRGHRKGGAVRRTSKDTAGKGRRSRLDGDTRGDGLLGVAHRRPD